MTRAAATRRARSSELQNEINRESNRSVAPAFGLAQDALLGVHGHYTRVRQIGQVGLHEPKSAQQPIGEVIMLALAEDPRPAGCESVKDAPRGTYRVRVGVYRVIYTVLDSEKVIVVARVRKRDESTYRRL